MKTTTMKNEPKAREVNQNISKYVMKELGECLEKRIDKDFIEEKEINQVCYECGVTANVLTCLKRYKGRPYKLSYDVSTICEGICDFCGEKNGVINVRDFFRPDFSLLQKNWILKLKKE